MTGFNDEAVALEVSAEDYRGFELLLEKYEAELYRFVFNLTQNDKLSEEILTLTFARFYADLADQNFPEVVRDKLYELAIASFYDLTNHRPLYSVEQAVQQLELSLLDADYAQRQNLQDIFLTCLLRLPVECRIVQVLVDVQGLKIVDVLNILKISAAEVDNLLHRGRTMLRRWMLEYGAVELIDKDNCNDCKQDFCVTRN